MSLAQATTIIAILLGSGCPAGRSQVTPASYREVPRARATECVQTCTDLGLKMTAVVVIMDSAGCVCEPAAEPATPQARVGGAGGVAAGAMISAAAAAAAVASQQQPQ